MGRVLDKGKKNGVTSTQIVSLFLDYAARDYLS